MVVCSAELDNLQGIEIAVLLFTPLKLDGANAKMIQGCIFKSNLTVRGMIVLDQETALSVQECAWPEFRKGEKNLSSFHVRIGPLLSMPRLCWRKSDGDVKILKKSEGRNWSEKKLNDLSGP